jgi:hypothetical protein
MTGGEGNLGFITYVLVLKIFEVPINREDSIALSVHLDRILKGNFPPRSYSQPKTIDAKKEKNSNLNSLSSNETGLNFGLRKLEVAFVRNISISERYWR